MSDTTSTPPPADLALVIDQLRDALTASPPELLDLKATLAFTSQSKASAYRGMSAGTFPRPVDTPSGNRWRRTDLLAWIKRLKSG